MAAGTERQLSLATLGGVGKQNSFQEDELSEQIEHRGWEIEDNYHEHFLDDPEVDLAGDFSEGNSGVFVGSIIALAVLVIAFWGLKLWIAPPVVYFRPALPPIIQHDAPGSFWAQIDKTWRVSCVYGKIETKTLRPYYENPNCTPEAAKKRGEW